jgi:hypothetical protein
MDDGSVNKRPVGLTVTALYKKSNRQIVDIQVEGIIKALDAKISQAHESGFNSISMELPTNFAINNMAKADAQILIYSMVLDILVRPEDNGGKGFDEKKVRFEQTATKTLLHVRWQNGMDADEKKERLMLIARFTSRDGK